MKSRKLTVGCCFNHGTLVPRIRIQGLWLTNLAGFQVGDQLRVIVVPGSSITITRIEDTHDTTTDSTRTD